MSDVAPRLSVDELLEDDMEDIEEEPPDAYTGHCYFETISAEVFHHIIKNLEFEDMKNIRLVNSSFLARSLRWWNKVEKHIFTFDQMSFEELLKFAKETKTILGLKIGELENYENRYNRPKYYQMTPEGHYYQEFYYEDRRPDQSIYVNICLSELARMHPELESLIILRSPCGNHGYKAMLSLPKIHTLHLNGSEYLASSWDYYESANFPDTHQARQMRVEFSEPSRITIDYDSDDSMCSCDDETIAANPNHSLSLNIAAYPERNYYNEHDLCERKPKGTQRHFRPKLLKNLDLAGCRFSNPDFLELLRYIGSAKTGHRAEMNSLDLSGTQVTLENLPPATSLGLKELSFECCQLSETGTTFFLKAVAANLTTLDLKKTNISLSGFIDDSSNVTFPSLKDLNLSGCKQLTDQGLSSFIKRTGDKLQSLDLSQTPVSFSTIGSVDTLHLKKVSLRDCQQLTEAGLLGLLEKAGATLRSLDLRNTSCTTPFKNSALVDKVRRLKELDLKQ